MQKLVSFMGLLVVATLSTQNIAAQEIVEQKKDSIQNILKQAQSGNAHAQNEVGTWYYRGDNEFKQNYSEALQWYSKSAQQGNALAIGNMGLCYQMGYGVEQDSVRAMQLYEKSIKDGNKALFNQKQKLADNNDVFNCVLIAYCNQKGIGTAKDNNKAIEYYTKAAKMNSIDAQRELALCYLNSQKTSEAVTWFKRGAENGDLSSTFYYGKLLCEGRGLEQDKQQGMVYLLKAAEAGFPMGQYEVGKAYYNGGAITKNIEQGAQWFLKAAQNGVSNAQYDLALCYVNGDGVIRDFDQATDWFSLALPQGHSTAFKKAFEDGGGSFKNTPYHTYLKAMSCYVLDKNYEEALKHFKTLEKAKFVEGKTMQGVILANKNYTKYNLKKGVKALQDAAKTSPMAMFLLGGMHEAGKGVDKNMDKALQYLTKAAGMGNASAQCYLGDMYYEGRSVPQDYAKAVEYYNMAKARLSANAAKRLASCYENGWGGLEVSKQKAEDILKKEYKNNQPELLKSVKL